MADLTPPPRTPAAHDVPPTGTTAKPPTGTTAGTTAKQPSADAASAKEKASGVASTATDQAKTVAADAASEAKNLVGDARKQLRTQADEQSKKVASGLGDLGSQFRQMANASSPGVARDMVASVADRAEQFARRLDEGGLDRTLDDARRWARNQPGVFLGVAAALGFVAIRVVRSADTDSLKQAASPTSNGEDTTPDPLRAGYVPPLTSAEGPR